MEVWLFWMVEQLIYLFIICILYFIDEAKVISFISINWNWSISFLINWDKQHLYKKEIIAIEYNITILAMPLYMLELIIGDFFTF